MRFFFEQLVANFSHHFKETRDQDVYPNQSVESCLTIYHLCLDSKPDIVIDIGTNYGASTISLALAMSQYGNDLSNMTTIDRKHKYWLNKTPGIQGELLKQYNLDISKITTMTRDFGIIDPKDLLKSDKKILVFYDMHDHKGPFSLKLLTEWVPLVKTGVIVLHDIFAVNDDFAFGEIKDDRPRTEARHFNGQLFVGFAECERVINWLNEKKINIKFMPPTGRSHDITPNSVVSWVVNE